MKAASLLLVLLVTCASAAFGGGVNIRWNACEGDAGTQNLAFACNSNIGASTLVCSITLDTDLLAVHSDELVVDIATASPTLPPWWELSGSGCRVGTFPALTIAAQDGPSCPDPFALEGSMNITGYLSGPALPGPPNRARILCVNTVRLVPSVDLVLADNPAGNATWGVARLRISNQRTLGTPSCAGCETPACVVFNSCNLLTVGNQNNRLVTGAHAPGADYVTWQGGGGTSCPAATPTRNSTWGAVKSLYR